jgi:hypothetical protein
MAEPRIEGQPPGTGFPEAETEPKKPRAVSAETETAETGTMKARHTRATLTGLHQCANG